MSGIKRKIWFIIYNFLFLVTALFAAPYFLIRMVRTGKYRKGLAQRFGLYGGRFRSLRNARPVWVHAVSVGEVKAATPLIKELKKRYGQRKVVLSTVTATGQEMAKKSVPEADVIFFFPLDIGGAVSQAVAQINPFLFITLETEIWPNLVATLRRRNIPAVMVNGRLSAKSFKRYRLVAPFLRHVLDCFSAFCMQTEADAKKIISLGADANRVRVCGNLKYDQEGPWLDLNAGEKALALLGLPACPDPCREAGREAVHREGSPRAGTRIFLAGSTHPGEEEVILAAYQELKKEAPDLLLVMAPRHPERFSEVERLMACSGVKVVRRTQVQAAPHPFDAILLDTIGELTLIYAAATIIFVGGSLVPVGGHNPLEPAGCGKPVFFGPYMENFQEIAQRLLLGGGAIQVKSGQELVEQAKRLLKDSEGYEQVGKAALAVVRANLGATQATLDVLEHFLKDSS